MIDPEDDEVDEDWSRHPDEDSDPWNCLFPDECCMPGIHRSSDCHTAEMLEQQHTEDEILATIPPIPPNFKYEINNHHSGGFEIRFKDCATSEVEMNCHCIYSESVDGRTLISSVMVFEWVKISKQQLRLSDVANIMESNRHYREHQAAEVNIHDWIKWEATR